jgi:Ca2+-binding EF-hand superfamily protein
MSRVLKYKPEFNKEELNSLAKSFKLFADKSGIMNLNNMVIAMKELKFDENEPVVYDLIAELESENKNGLTYDDFVDRLTEKLQDRESEKSIERVYDLFVEDPKGTVTYEVLKKVHQDIGEDASEEDLRRLIKSGASNGTDIPYEEFRSIMIKDISLK